MSFLRLAGALQLAVAAANIPLTWMLRFGREQSRLAPIVRQIHQVHHLYIGLMLVVFAAMSLIFPRDLTAGDGLGRFVSALLAVFWGARLAIQRLYYDPDFLRQHRWGDVAFSGIFTVLFAVYAAAAAGALR